MPLVERSLAEVLPRPLGRALRLTAVLLAIALLEIVAWSALRPAGAEIAQASTAGRPEERVAALHVVLSRGELRADRKLQAELLSSPHALIREFGASPTLAKFDIDAGALLDRHIRAESDPRVAFRMRLWRNYQPGVSTPPMFLSSRTIERYFTSLEGDARGFERVASPLLQPSSTP